MIRLIVTAILMVVTGTTMSQAQIRSEANLLSQFNSGPIGIDGIEEQAWTQAQSSRVEKRMSADLSKSAEDCETHGVIRSLWDGASLYLFVKVFDTNVAASAPKISDQDGVAIYVDLMNDKFPKYLEDDGMLFISAKGERLTQGTDVARFGASAAMPIYDAKGLQAGYAIEAVFHMGGIVIANATRIGLEIAISNTDSTSKTLKHKIFWNSAAHNGLNDTSTWGTVILTGYNGKSPEAIDDYSLMSNIEKAASLPRGIWENEKLVEQALTNAKYAREKKNQVLIDRANASLDKALKDLRRSGPYKDPYDLPAINHLPDPFTFQNGKKVKNETDWTNRAEEIKSLAQYYEYGQLPDKPERVTATLSDKKFIVTVTDKGKSVSFEAQLTLPSQTQRRDRKTFPVMVSIDFFIRDADTIFLNAGCAVLNFRYTSVASDNMEHTGPFYELYPYDVKTNHDAGTLLAWAWGAIRCVDAMEYLKKNNDPVGQLLDLDKVVVTGFSRCGKAALAAGLFDNRFGVVSPGASGCGGAAVYRYASFGSSPKRKSPFGNEYPWGASPGCEVLGDKIRHQGHNSNAMLARLLDQNRIYNTQTFGYGERLPYDHHQIIAAIAPRAVLITTANDDYANNAEGDAIGFEGAKPVYTFLGVTDKLGLNIRTTGEVNPRGFGGGHWLSVQQKRNLTLFANAIFYNEPLPQPLQKALYTNPYLPTFEKYYGGVHAMMPWYVK